MNDTTRSSDQWEACPPGELARVAERLKARRRRRALVKIGGASAALALVLLAGGLIAWQLGGPAEYHFGNIACHEARPLLPQYAAKKLDVELTKRIDVHLDQCPKCGPVYREMRSPRGNETALLGLVAVPMR